MDTNAAEDVQNKRVAARKDPKAQVVVYTNCNENLATRHMKSKAVIMIDSEIVI